MHVFEYHYDCFAHSKLFFSHSILNRYYYCVYHEVKAGRDERNLYLYPGFFNRNLIQIDVIRVKNIVSIYF